MVKMATSQNGRIRNIGKCNLYFLWYWFTRLQPDMRATHRAGHRLGVKTAIQRIVIFGRTIGAHHKGRHSCLGTVVGDIFYDSEAGAAIRAIDEWVTVSAILGVEHLLQAILAEADIRGDGDEITRFSFRVYDFEAGEPISRDPVNIN